MYAISNRYLRRRTVELDAIAEARAPHRIGSRREIAGISDRLGTHDDFMFAFTSIGENQINISYRLIKKGTWK